MPNGENWQGDVLRDLRAPAPGPTPDQAQARAQAQTQLQALDQAQATAAQTFAQALTAPEQGSAPGYEQGYGQAYGQGYEQAPAGQPQGAAPGRQAVAPRSPDSRPTVDRNLAAVARKPRSGEALATRVARAVWKNVSKSAAREVAEATRTAEILQQPVTTGRQIAVTSIRGGAGKSTVAALLGTTYAHYRKDPVLFVEADPALGSLPVKLGAETVRWTTSDVADIVKPQMSLLDVTGYLVQLRNNSWLLPGSQGQIGTMLDARGYQRVMVALRRYFGITVVDCQTLPAEVARVALSASQARVLTTPATLDGVASTHEVLQWMRGLPPHVIAGTVVVVTEQTPHSGVDLDAAVRTLRSTGTSVHLLRYDRHLAAGGTIRTDLLTRATRTTATRLAADVFELSQKRH
ncbi:MinD/ParA family protein [Kitasatospora sp. NPDC058406]|uniref:MinD/ParA family protein n=1 Tax=Kitasatospora sp. NPDC058406 TaxID=3346483 RepID=UPI00366714A6